MMKPLGLSPDNRFPSQPYTRSVNTAPSIPISKPAPTDLFFAILAATTAIYLFQNLATRLANLEWQLLNQNPFVWFHMIYYEYLATLFGLFISAYGIYRKMRWALYATVLTALIFLNSILTGLFFFGPYGNEAFYVFSLASGCLLLVQFSRKSVRAAYFRYVYADIFFVLVAVIISCFSAVEVKGIYDHYRDIPRLKETIYLSHLPPNVNLPLGFSLAVPETSRLACLFVKPGKTIWFRSRGNLIIMGNQNPSAFNAYPVLEYISRDYYDCLELMFINKVGFIWATAREIVFPYNISAVEKVDINGLKGFLIKGRTDDNKFFTDFYIFKGRTLVGRVEMFTNPGKGGITQAAVDDILSSISIVKWPETSATECFTSAKMFARAGRTEKAKMSLANALLTDWGNLEYHYEYANICMGMKDYCQAERHYMNIVRMKPDYKNAAALLVEAHNLLVGEKRRFRLKAASVPADEALAKAGISPQIR